MVNLKSLILISFPLLILTLNACGQPKPSEQLVYDILEDNNTTFYFKDDSGNKRGEAYSLEEILKVKIPLNEQQTIENDLRPGDSNIKMDSSFEEPDIAIVAEEPGVNLKKITPTSQAKSGRVIMQMNDGKGNFFYVGMNYETNIPRAISFQTKMGSHNIQMHFYYNENGELSEYSYYEDEAYRSNWETVSYKFIDEKLYIYDKSNLKVERNLDIKDKERVLSKSIILSTLVKKLWYLYSPCPKVDFNLEIDEPKLAISTDSIMHVFQTTQILDKNKIAIWETFKDNKIQIIYTLKKEGINISRSMEMYSLTLKKGKITDPKIKAYFEKILRKYIICTDSQYRCLTRNGTGEVSIIIENGKILTIE